MFIIKNSSGKEVPVKEIYENGFDVTMSNNHSGLIKRTKRDVFGEYLLDIKENKGRSSLFEIIPTGIQFLDNALGGGLQPGVYLLGANPGTGKTSLLLHILINMALNKQHSIFFNLDMSDLQTTFRLYSNYSYRCDNLHSYTINDISDSKNLYSNGKLTSDILALNKAYSKNIDEYIEVLSRDNTNISDNTSDEIYYIDSIENAIRNTIKYYCTKPVVVIDFFQQLKKQNSIEEEEIDNNLNKRLEIDYLIQKLKSLSNVYKVPIIAISSINRSSYTNNNVYDISFCKESGNIDYQADVLMRLVEEEDNVNFGGPNTKNIGLYIVKTRSGMKHVSTQLEFIPEYTYFKEQEN